MQGAHRMAALVTLGFALAASASADAVGDADGGPGAGDLLRELEDLAPRAEPRVLEHAVTAIDCARSRGIGTEARTLTVIDYSVPSLEPRLWVFDLRERRLLFEEHVAHGRNTGENDAVRFSNQEGSLQSSLGLFLTAETYEGRNGYSLRLDGLETGVNDRARDRAIVMHGAPYVDPEWCRKQGRLGRSWGCPAVRPEVAGALLDAIRGGSFVLAWYPDARWLSSSEFLLCDDARGSRRARGGLSGPKRGAKTR